MGLSTAPTNWSQSLSWSAIEWFQFSILTLLPFYSFQSIQRLSRLYNNVDEVDLFVAGVAERSVPGALLGPTFICLVGDQFSRLRRGDRFFYEEAKQPSSFSSGIYKGCPKITETLFRMAKLHIAACSQVAVWSAINSTSSSKFHLVITFHWWVTAIFVKVFFITPLKFELPKMDVKNEWRSAIKFCCLLKKFPVETVKLIHEAYIDEEQLEDLAIFHWCKAFFKGWKTTALLLHVGQPLSICTEKMSNTVAAPLPFLKIVATACYTLLHVFATWL